MQSFLARPNLDPFFAYLAALNSTAKCPYPDLQSVLERYKALIDVAPQTHELMSLFGARGGELELFEQEFHLLEHCSYSMLWSIPAAQQVVAQGRLQPISFHVPALAQVIDEAGLDRAYLPHALQNDQPILAAACPASQCIVLIDGNHRVWSRHLAGQAVVAGYLLQPHQHLQAAATDRHRMLFMIHHNLWLMANYMIGNIPMKTVLQHAMAV